MKAIRYHEYGSPSVLTLEEVPLEKLKDGQVRVHVEAAGVNFADTMQRRNLYPIAGDLPRTPGFEASGIVEEVAAGVKDFKVGDRVIALPIGGAYSESVVADTNNVFQIPEKVSFDQAVALPGQALTAYYIYKDAPLLEQETVLIHAAAGGVGSVAAQIANILGAKKVIGTTSTRAKLEKLKGYGYHHGINITEPDWYKKVLELTDGKGADVILDSVGGPVFDEGMKGLAPGGKMVVFGGASGKSTTFDPRVLTAGNQRVLGFSLWKYMANKSALEQGLDFLFKALIDGSLKVDLEVYPMSKAAEVHTLMEARNTTGKIVLKP